MAARILNGDVFDLLPALTPGSVDLCLTSPPYWQLRSYLPKDHPLKPRELGSEATPAAFVQRLVELFRLVRAALAPHATAWINCGDTYSGGGGSGKQNLDSLGARLGTGGGHKQSGFDCQRGSAAPGIPPGNLCLIPWRLAIALQDDGWLVRSVIVWHKPAPMPASLSGWAWKRCRVKVEGTGHKRDRLKGNGDARPKMTNHSGNHYETATWAPCPGCPKCTPHGGYVLRRGSWRATSSWEPILMLAKGSTYYADGEACKVPMLSGSVERYAYSFGGAKNEHIKESGQNRTYVVGDRDPSAGANLRDVWTISSESSTCGLCEPCGRFWAAAAPDAHCGQQVLKHYACVDAETECLTSTGWKRHDTIRAGDVAAQYDMRTGCLSWGQVAAVSTYHVADQEMIAVHHHRGVRMLLTPNHRTIIHRRFPKRGTGVQPPVFIRADELKAGHCIPIAAPWKESPANAGIGADWAELLGWYVAEGCEGQSGWGVDIYQSPTANPGKTQRIRSLLLAVGAEFREATAQRPWKDRITDLTAFSVLGYAAIRLRELAPGKSLSWGLLGLPESELAALFAGLVGGDGHIRKDDGRASFVQKSQATVDFFQALATRLGYATKATFRSMGTSTVFVTRKRHMSLRGASGKAVGTRRERYTGIVWCPTLPLGTWVARKAGRVFITGNSFPTELVYRCLAAGTSQKGYCPRCSAPWCRVIEKEPVGAYHDHAADGVEYGLRQGGRGPAATYDSGKTLGWRPSCNCPGDLPPRPGLVLDPFSGSCRVGLQAARMGLDFVGIELHAGYAQLGRHLLRDASPLFAE